MYALRFITNSFLLCCYHIIRICMQREKNRLYVRIHTHIILSSSLETPSYKNILLGLMKENTIHVFTSLPCPLDALVSGLLLLLLALNSKINIYISLDC